MRAKNSDSNKNQRKALVIKLSINETAEYTGFLKSITPNAAQIKIEEKV